MGRGIVYCVDCGERLREDAFDGGKAQMLDDRPYCTRCRPIVETPADPTPSRGYRLRSGVPTPRAPLPAVATPRTPLPAVPKAGSKLPLLAGAAAAGAALLVLVFMIFSGGSAPEAAPAEASGPRAAAPADRATETLKTLEAFAAGNPDPAVFLGRCEQARRLLRGTKHEARLDQLEARAVEAQMAAARKGGARIDEFLASLRKMIKSDPGFQRRAEVEGMFESAKRLDASKAEGLEREKQAYAKLFEDTARHACELAAAEGRKLASAGRPEDAVARLDECPPVFLATPHGAPLAALRRDFAAQSERLSRLRSRPRHEASHCNPNDTLAALSDGRLPKSSGDGSIPRMTFWDHRGTKEWITYGFDELRKIDAVEVYWFDDTGKGNCRVPASWKLFRLDGEEWREIPGAGGVAPDRFNKASFPAVETWALRIEVQLQPGWSGGVLEWLVRP